MMVMDGFAIDLERRTAVHLQHRHTFTFHAQSSRDDHPTPTYWWIFDRTDASPRELIAAATAAYHRALGLRA